KSSRSRRSPLSACRLLPCHRHGNLFFRKLSASAVKPSDLRIPCARAHPAGSAVLVDDGEDVVTEPLQLRGTDAGDLGEPSGVQRTLFRDGQQRGVGEHDERRNIQLPRPFGTPLFETFQKLFVDVGGAVHTTPDLDLQGRPQAAFAHPARRLGSGASARRPTWSSGRLVLRYESVQESAAATVGSPTRGTGQRPCQRQVDRKSVV